MKLSDLKPEDVEVEDAKPAKLKLSSLDPSDYSAESPHEPTTGERLKKYAEDTVIDQLPALGAAGGGLAGGVAGSAAGGVGAVPGALAGAGVGGYLGKATQNLYNHFMRPEMEPKTVADAVTEPIVEGAKGVGLEGAGVLGGQALGKAISPLSSRVSSYLRSKAGSLAEKATGATGAQVYNKFADNAGQELLDRGIVGFGKTQGGIAKAAREALDQSRGDISSALNALDAKGSGVTRDEILDALKAEAGNLKSKPSQAATRRQLESVAEDVAAGPERYTLNEAENEKRAFQDKVNWANPDKNPGNATSSDVYRRIVEKNASAVDPDIASQFQQGKKDFGLLAPITEAAEKRAAANAQRSSVSLHSLGTGTLGSLVGGEEGYRHGGLSGALAGAAAGAVIGPRVISSSASMANGLSKLIRSSPEALGKFAAPLAQAEARGPEALNLMHKILSSDPEYLMQLKYATGVPPSGRDPAETDQ